MAKYSLSENVSWANIMRTLRWSIRHEYFSFLAHYDYLIIALKLDRPNDARIHLIACRRSYSSVLNQIDAYNSLRRFLGYKLASLSSFGFDLMIKFDSEYGGAADV